MSVGDELIEIERELATGGGEAYREHMLAHGIVVVPGMRLDRDSTIEAIDSARGWDRFEISDAQGIDLGGDAALVSYRFMGWRGDELYDALASSVYERAGSGGWKLALHQQTPIPEGPDSADAADAAESAPAGDG
ncbi:nuclear transport factor 2 family protein [Thermoleophilia bacterium SCSIO 60948]|nr:nuclear transport factor 2 family protein [Thermoleophilia bacterium SCSIO 60948]